MSRPDSFIPTVPVYRFWDHDFLSMLDQLCKPIDRARRGDVVAVQRVVRLHTAFTPSTPPHVRIPTLLPVKDAFDLILASDRDSLEVKLRQPTSASIAAQPPEERFFYALDGEPWIRNIRDLTRLHRHRVPPLASSADFCIWLSPEGMVSVRTALQEQSQAESTALDHAASHNRADALAGIYVPQLDSAHERIAQQSLLEPEGNLASLSRQLLAQHHPDISWLQEIPLRFAPVP